MRFFEGAAPVMRRLRVIQYHEEEGQLYHESTIVSDFCVAFAEIASSVMTWIVFRSRWRSSVTNRKALCGRTVVACEK